MRVEFKPITPASLTFIAANLRPEDENEFQIAFPGVSTYAVAASVLQFPGVGYICWLDGSPVFAFGVVAEPAAKHRGNAWGFGTPDTPKAIREITKFVREVFIPELSEIFLRVDVRVLKSYTKSTNWLARALRAKLETELPCYGANGETFLQLSLSWSKPPCVAPTK